MRAIRGTAAYLGIGTSIEDICAHLRLAAGVGINAVFTSLQLPESDKAVLFRDFPVMVETAHSLGMLVDADVGERSCRMFGIELGDFAAFSRLGLDIVRLDNGYTPEQIVAASNNKFGIIAELNAAHVDDDFLSTLVALGINKEQVHFCHNYYPMRYTGFSFEEAKKNNDLIHRYGFRVGGFIPSHSHHRIACGIGLPTIEHHRYLKSDVAIREGYLAGFDDFFFGDDFASEEEMRRLVQIDGRVVVFRMTEHVEHGVIDWLLDRELLQTQFGLKMMIRSNFDKSTYPGFVDDLPSSARKRGDVTVCKSGLYRYKGEIQIARQDMPEDPDIAVIGRISEDDMSLLDTFNYPVPFMLSKV